MTNRVKVIAAAAFAIMLLAVLTVGFDRIGANTAHNDSPNNEEQMQVDTDELTNQEEKKEEENQADTPVDEEETQVAQASPANNNQNQAVQQPNRRPNNDAIRGTSRTDEVYWLARIIHAEAEGESYTGKVAVGNVVVNRVNNPRFPNTIYGVIFDVQEGYTQFSPVLDGRIYNTPNSESIRAAEAALNGERPVGSALYFLNPKKAENFWIPKNRKYMMTVGGHDFYY
ncbi:cell wall hydrolase [Desulfofalx alkaliphila]|uniref:cell wall hydrolase n=1 Tax=Desulfofalx alkaliphila TaxID=105483 RepID=UPI00068E6039|nr:cell wall hydrolase [Desulfofalx alkaliphila]